MGRRVAQRRRSSVEHSAPPEPEPLSPHTRRAQGAVEEALASWAASQLPSYLKPTASSVLAQLEHQQHVQQQQAQQALIVARPGVRRPMGAAATAATMLGGGRGAAPQRSTLSPAGASTFSPPTLTIGAGTGATPYAGSPAVALPGSVMGSPPAHTHRALTGAASSILRSPSRGGSASGSAEGSPRTG